MTKGEEFLISVLNTNSEEYIYKVPKDWLFEEREMIYYNFILDYLRDSNELPKTSVFMDKFRLKGVSVEGLPSHYYKELNNRFIYVSISEAVPALMTKLKKSPMGSLDGFKELVSSVSVDFASKDISYFKDAEKRFEGYLERILSKGITYMSTGVEVLDKEMYGYKAHDLITIAGRSGLGKTWYVIWLALMCEKTLPEGFGPILFVSNEMDDVEIAERMDCIRFKLDYGRFLKGELTDAEKSRYEKGSKRLSKTGNSRIQIIYNCDRIDSLREKIKVYRPSIVFVDGSYLMEPDLDEGWQRISYITRNLKSVAKTQATPIINTTQLTRGAGKKKSKLSTDSQDEYAFGMSYINDSDISFRFYQTPDMVYHSEIGIDVAKGRRMRSGVSFVWKRSLLHSTYSMGYPTSTGDDDEPSEIRETTKIIF